MTLRPQFIWAIAVVTPLLFSPIVRGASTEGEPTGAPRFDAEAMQSLERMNEYLSAAKQFTEIGRAHV